MSIKIIFESQAECVLNVNGCYFGILTQRGKAFEFLPSEEVVLECKPLHNAFKPFCVKFVASRVFDRKCSELVVLMIKRDTFIVKISPQKSVERLPLNAIKQLETQGNVATLCYDGEYHLFFDFHEKMFSRKINFDCSNATIEEMQDLIKDQTVIFLRAKDTSTNFYGVYKISNGEVQVLFEKEGLAIKLAENRILLKEQTKTFVGAEIVSEYVLEEDYFKNSRTKVLRMNNNLFSCGNKNLLAIAFFQTIRLNLIKPFKEFLSKDLLESFDISIAKQFFGNFVLEKIIYDNVKVLKKNSNQVVVNLFYQVETNNEQSEKSFENLQSHNLFSKQFCLQFENNKIVDASQIEA